MLGLGVAVAGAAGAVCRYLLDGAVQERWGGPFPMGTLVVNVVGSLLLGTLVGLAERGPGLGGLEAVLGAGFAGGFTTFSTLMFETAVLLRDGARRYAAANLAANLLGGLAALVLGLALGRAW